MIYRAAVVLNTVIAYLARYESFTAIGMLRVFCSLPAASRFAVLTRYH